MTRIVCDICGAEFRRGRTFHEHLKKSKCTRVSSLLSVLGKKQAGKIDNPNIEYVPNEDLVDIKIEPDLDSNIVQSTVTPADSTVSDSESSLSDTGFEEVLVTADGDIPVFHSDNSDSYESDGVDWDLLESEGKIETFQEPEQAHPIGMKQGKQGKRQPVLKDILVPELNDKEKENKTASFVRSAAEVSKSRKRKRISGNDDEVDGKIVNDMVPKRFNKRKLVKPSTSSRDKVLIESDYSSDDENFIQSSKGGRGKKKWKKNPGSGLPKTTGRGYLIQNKNAGKKHDISIESDSSSDSDTKIHVTRSQAKSKNLKALSIKSHEKSSEKLEKNQITYNSKIRKDVNASQGQSKLNVKANEVDATDKLNSTSKTRPKGRSSKKSKVQKRELKRTPVTSDSDLSDDELPVDNNMQINQNVTEISFKEKLRSYRRNVSSEVRDGVKISDETNSFEELQTQSVPEESASSGTFMCGICSTYFENDKSLEEHIFTHSNKVEDENTSEFICGICSKVYHCQESLASHMSEHMKGLDENNLIQDGSNGEKITESEEKEHCAVYICGICKKRYFDLEVLQRHLSTHSNIINIQDTFEEDVDSNFNESPPENFKGNKTDAKTGDFEAAGCVSETSTLSVPAYICGACKKGFFDTEALQKHITTHSNTRGVPEIIKVDMYSGSNENQAVAGGRTESGKTRTDIPVTKVNPALVTTQTGRDTISVPDRFKLDKGNHSNGYHVLTSLLDHRNSSETNKNIVSEAKTMSVPSNLSYKNALPSTFRSPTVKNMLISKRENSSVKVSVSKTVKNPIYSALLKKIGQSSAEKDKGKQGLHACTSQSDFSKVGVKKTYQSSAEKDKGKQVLHACTSQSDISKVGVKKIYHEVNPPFVPALKLLFGSHLARLAQRDNVIPVKRKDTGAIQSDVGKVIVSKKISDSASSPPIQIDLTSEDTCTPAKTIDKVPTSTNETKSGQNGMAVTSNKEVNPGNSLQATSERDNVIPVKRKDTGTIQSDIGKVVVSKTISDPASSPTIQIDLTSEDTCSPAKTIDKVPTSTNETKSGQNGIAVTSNKEVNPGNSLQATSERDNVIPVKRKDTGTIQSDIGKAVVSKTISDPASSPPIQIDLTSEDTCTPAKTIDKVPTSTNETKSGQNGIAVTSNKEVNPGNLFQASFVVKSSVNGLAKDPKLDISVVSSNSPSTTEKEKTDKKAVVLDKIDRKELKKMTISKLMKYKPKFLINPSPNDKTSALPD